MVAVHGLWTQRHTLHLWAEEDGVPAPREAEAATSPEAAAALAERAPTLAAALARRSRASADVLLPDPGGSLVRHSLPGVALAPDRATDVLLEVAAWAADDEGGQAGSVLADDLVFLAEVTAAVGARVAAGAVVPTLVDDAGTFLGRWTLLADGPWQRWRAAAAAAAPGVLGAEVGPDGAGAAVPDVLGDLADQVTDHLVTARVGAALAGDVGDAARAAAASWTRAGTAARASAAWVDGVRRRTPVVGLGSDLRALTERVRAWHASATGAPAELLLRLSEPRGAAGPDASEATGEPGDPTDSPLDGTADGSLDPPGAWLLQVRLRSVDDPSLVLTPEQARQGVGGFWWTLPQDPLAFTLTELARAAAVYRPLGDILGADMLGAGVLEAPIGVQALLDLVGTGVPRLLEAGVAVQLPGRWLTPDVSLKLRATSAPEPGEGAVARAFDDPARLGLGELVDYSWQVALGEEVLTQDELSALVAAKSPLVRLRGTWVQVDADRLARSLRFLERAGTGRAAVGTLLGAAAGVGVPAPVSAVEVTGRLDGLLSGDLARVAPPVPTPRGLNAQLRPYQERGLAWLAAMSDLRLGVLLADDMGLGKTVQLLALLVHEREQAPDRHPTLLVCPMSVVGNWQREAARFAPGLRVLVHHGPGRATGSDLADAVAQADLVVTTYAVLVRDAEALAQLPWGRLAVDEAQHVKNASTRAARALRAVAAGAPPATGTHRVALTGTPVENRLADLHSLLDLVNPGLLGPAATFRERFAVPLERGRDPRAAAVLATLTRPFVLRRVKTDRSVIADLPEKIEMVVRANLTAEQASLYQAVLDDVMARIAAARGIERRGLVLSALTRLKQVCNHPAHALGDGSPLLRRGQHRSGKLALLDDVLDTVVADGERALCFTQYREFGAMLVPHLSARYEQSIPFLHGRLTKSAREGLVESFGHADGPPVMVLSLRAGGTGLNLTAANHVVHLDRWWNPAVEDQATDRVFRIGQTRGVQVRKFVCVGTLEERIDALMVGKRELADAVVGSGEGWIGELGTDDLRELLSLGAEAVGD